MRVGEGRAGLQLRIVRALYSLAPLLIIPVVGFTGQCYVHCARVAPAEAVAEQQAKNYGYCVHVRSRVGGSSGLIALAEIDYISFLVHDVEPSLLGQILIPEPFGFEV